MRSFPHLILGGGMVAGYAAKEFVERGLKPGELAIISSDSVLPYERPPLSKGYLAGRDSEDAILINPENFYRGHGIELRLGAVAERVDFERRGLEVRGGDEYGWEKLLIATGAHPRLLTVPGAGLDRVHYLRSRDDSRRIREAARGAQSAVVIGGGFISMEVASVLAQQGVATTMLVREHRIWKNLFTPDMSAFFQRYYEARGVRVVTDAEVASITAAGVALASGQALPAQLVVAGIGVLPVTELFEGSGLALDNGIVVNQYLETNLPGVFAAGDVAEYPDLVFGKRRRVEHWDNAVKQGQHAARVMTGLREPFDNVPYFFSDLFDLSWEFWGDTTDCDRAVRRGVYDSKSFSVWWLKDKRPVAAFVMNRPDEERELAQQWIRDKAEVSPDQLADESRPLR